MKDEHKKIATGKIPNTWQTVKVNDIATTVRGASPRPKGDPRYYGGSVPRLMGEDVTRDGKFVTPQVDFLTEEGAKKSRFMHSGTLVMVCSGNVGVPAILAVDACVHDGFLAFPEVSDKCHLDYLYYTFDSLHEKLNSSATHGGIFTNLTTSIIKDFEITLPPLPEQQKIAEILSTVDEKIEVIGEQISQTQELKRGLMQRLLTKGIGHTQFKDSPLGKIPESWEVVKVIDIATVVRGASPRPKGDPKYYGGSVPRLMGEDVTRDGKFVTPQVDFLTEEGAKKSRFMKAGTLVMICSGNVGVPSILAVDACVHDGFLAFPEISDICHLDYLYYTFDSLHEKLNSSATHGGVFTNLTTSIIKDFEVSLPPLAEQEKIAAIFSAVDEKLEVLQDKKQEYQELKRGLMQQLLTGKVRVTNLLTKAVPA